MSRAGTSGIIEDSLMRTAQGRVGDFFEEAGEDGIEDDDRFSVKSAQGENPHYSMVDIIDSGISGSINESSRGYVHGSTAAQQPITFSGTLLLLGLIFILSSIFQSQRGTPPCAVQPLNTCLLCDYGNCCIGKKQMSTCSDLEEDEGLSDDAEPAVVIHGRHDKS